MVSKSRAARGACHLQGHLAVSTVQTGSRPVSSLHVSRRRLSSPAHHVNVELGATAVHTRRRGAHVENLTSHNLLLLMWGWAGFRERATPRCPGAVHPVYVHPCRPGCTAGSDRTAAITTSGHSFRGHMPPVSSPHRSVAFINRGTKGKELWVSCKVNERNEPR